VEAGSECPDIEGSIPLYTVVPISAPGGTNFPHHHEYTEEIYLLMDGHGEKVAGGRTDGVEGLDPAKAGDACLYRQNCTVGFYDSKDGRADILAIQSRLPIPKYPC
jgi:hypothetical protein